MGFLPTWKERIAITILYHYCKWLERIQRLFSKKEEPKDEVEELIDDGGG